MPPRPLVDLSPHPDAGRTIVLADTLPTPNGPLHLGHLVPFLGYDAIARHLRRRGVDVRVVGGTDIHESHVFLAAHRDGKDPQALAEDLTDRIRDDLADADIEFDRFLDLTGGALRTRYDQGIVAWWQRLRSAGAVTRRDDLAPFAAGRPLVGGLAGRCPSCDADAAGFSCEACGDAFSPAELRDPRPRLNHPSWQLRTVRLPFLDFRDVDDLERAATCVLPHSADREWVRRYLRRRGPTYRLGVASDHGVPIPGHDATERLYSYAFFPAFVDLALDELGLAWDDSIRVCKSIGIDNLIPTAIATQGTLLAVGHRPLDFITVNRFLRLDGKKFSTSRGHAIWVRDLLRDGDVPADALRLFLALHAPTDAESNFDAQAFARFHREVFDRRLRPVAAEVRDRRVAAAPLPDGLRDTFAVLAAVMDVALHPARVDLPAVAGAVLRWIDLEPSRDAGHRGAWIDGLRWLAAPLLPAWCRALDAATRDA